MPDKKSPSRTKRGKQIKQLKSQTPSPIKLGEPNPKKTIADIIKELSK